MRAGAVSVKADVRSLQTKVESVRAAVTRVLTDVFVTQRGKTSDK